MKLREIKVNNHSALVAWTYLLTVNPVANGILKFNVVVTGLLAASGPVSSMGIQFPPSLEAEALLLLSP